MARIRRGGLLQVGSGGGWQKEALSNVVETRRAAQRVRKDFLATLDNDRFQIRNCLGAPTEGAPLCNCKLVRKYRARILAGRGDESSHGEGLSVRAAIF